MNNNQTNQNGTNLEQNNSVDSRYSEAEVIGELRKDKIGKPLLVLEMFVLFGIVLIALPIVTNMLNDENSFLYKMIYGTPVVSPTPNMPISEFLDGGVEQLIASSTKMKKDNIVISNFSLNKNEIKFKMYSYNSLLDLDNDSYFLEVYSSSKKKLGALKLTGIYDNQEQDVTLASNEINYNENYNYYAKIVKMEDKDYPSVTITSDESGIGSITCKKDGQSIEYVFKNGYLIAINDYSHIGISGKDSNEYLRLKREFEGKSSLLSGISTIEEVNDGFVYRANINLENYKIPENLIDYNYYKLDTEAKIINYTQIGKGYDCK